MTPPKATSDGLKDYGPGELRPQEEIDEYLRHRLRPCGVRMCAHKLDMDDDDVIARGLELGLIGYVGRSGNFYPKHDALIKAALRALVTETGFAATVLIKRMQKLNRNNGLEVPDLPVPRYKEDG